MVYKISMIFLVKIDASGANSQDISNKVLVNYTISDKNTNFSLAKSENELADFLTHAARLNAPVASVEVEKDNTLDFLTEAAQLNTPVAALEEEQDTH